MHRKFIALILATSVAVTGLSAAPAHADGKTARIFAGLAALAILGAVINDSNRRHNVNRYQTQPYPKPQPQPKPLPPRNNSRYLPQACLSNHNVNGQYRRLFGAACLKRHYVKPNTLPYACQLGYWDGRKNRTGYEPKCLRERGYRFAAR